LVFFVFLVFKHNILSISQHRPSQNSFQILFCSLYSSISYIFFLLQVQFCTQNVSKVWRKTKNLFLLKTPKKKEKKRNTIFVDQSTIAKFNNFSNNQTKSRLRKIFIYNCYWKEHVWHITRSSLRKNVHTKKQSTTNTNKLKVNHEMDRHASKMLVEGDNREKEKKTKTLWLSWTPSQIK